VPSPFTAATAAHPDTTTIHHVNGSIASVPALVTRDELLTLLDSLEAANTHARDNNTPEKTAAVIADAYSKLFGLHDVTGYSRSKVEPATEQQLDQIREIWHAVRRDIIARPDVTRVRSGARVTLLRAVYQPLHLDEYDTGTVIRHLYSIAVGSNIEPLIRLRRHWPLLQHHPAALSDTADIDDRALTKLYRQLHDAAVELDQLPYATLANQLAADDPDRRHTWDELLHTAAALTPSPAPCR
jgi:hypothetical protein